MNTLKSKLSKNNKPQVINITGTNGKTTTARIVEKVLTSAGYKTGLISTAGLFFKGKKIKAGDQVNFESFQYIYQHRDELDFIICENIIRNITKDIFYPQKADICLLTNISPDHLNQTKTNSIEELISIKSSIINLNKKSGLIILNMDNKNTLNIARNYPEKDKIVLFSRKKSKLNSVTQFNDFYYLKNKDIFSAQRKSSAILEDIQKLPLTLDMKLTFNIENLIAAVSIIDNLDIEISKSRLDRYLQNFSLNFKDLPGRFNTFQFKNFQVIIDYAHNPASIQKLLKVAKKIPHKRLVTVAKGPSIRDKENEEMLRKIAKIISKFSDLVYIKEPFPQYCTKDKTLRQRTVSFLENEIANTGKLSNEKIISIMEEEKAVRTAIGNAKKGDLIIILAYKTVALNNLLEKMQKKSPTL